MPRWRSSLSQTELISAQAQLDLLQAILETLGINAEEDLNRLADIVGRVEDTLSPVLDRVSGGIGTLRELLLTIRDTLERINELPLVNIEIPGIEGIEQGAEQSAEPAEPDRRRRWKNRAALPNHAGHGRLTLHRVCPAGEISINSLLETLDEYAVKIEATQDQLAYLEENLPKWIDYSAAILTVILVWLGISQVGLFVLGWSFYKGQDLISPTGVELEAQTKTD